MNKQVLTATAGLAVAVGGIGLSTASAQPAAPARSCGPAHSYIDVQHETVTPNKALVVHGKSATLKCGGPDDSSYVTGQAITVTLTRTATVTFWKMQNDPSKGTRTVTATAAPQWFHRNRFEPIYKITGPHDAATKLVEEWHP
jgi:hypothetical protein